ncbi:MAG: carboxypeptidase regulatory-like domain-containing protein [Gemmatimonadaceae bacterium]
MRFTLRQIVVASLSAAVGCRGGDNTSSASAQGIGDTIGMARRAPVIAKPSTPYRVANVVDGGRLSGTVSFSGTPQGDTIVIVPADQNGCGKPLTIRRLERRNGKVANALVWITDVRSGRALPTDQRFNLENDDCAWTPVIQGVTAGGAINVTNSDPLAERAYITDVASGDTVTVAPFTDDGQLIPYDKLIASPGVHEFSVESRPMSRAWVAAFDHPYFAVTDANGSFSIDGIPAGTYHVRAWHPMLGATDGTVTIAANGTANTDLNFH